MRSWPQLAAPDQRQTGSHYSQLQLQPSLGCQELLSGLPPMLTILFIEEFRFSKSKVGSDDESTVLRPITPITMLAWLLYHVTNYDAHLTVNNRHVTQVCTSGISPVITCLVVFFRCFLVSSIKIADKGLGRGGKWDNFRNIFWEMCLVSSR